MTTAVDAVVVGLSGLGSAACWQLARRGASVIGLEQFALGHDQGASHDTSRIIRRSYHTPGYVRLAGEAYDDWQEVEASSGESLLTITGGLDLFPPGAAIPPDDYIMSMAAAGVRFSMLDAAAVQQHWPQFDLPDATQALHSPDTGIVPAARGTAVLQRLAAQAGATLRGNARVTQVSDAGTSVVVDTTDASYSCSRLVLTADAWTNRVLAPLAVRLPLTVLREQVSYFEPPNPEPFAPGRFPVWIWMNDPSFFGFPCYGEPTVKAAQDCGGAPIDPDSGDRRPDDDSRRRLQAFVQRLVPTAGSIIRTKTCLYTLTPDRDFVLGPIPGHESVLVGLGAAHGFKFAPTLGRLLTDLAETGRTASDITPFATDRPALREPAHPVTWLV